MSAPSSKWEAVIGLEVHAQLKTRSKLFSACPVAGGSTADLAPNTFTDEVVLALPGTLPVPNAEAVRLAVRLGLALGCRIDRHSQFARKHYFYPDLPKGYQISQYEDPLCTGGAVPITLLETSRACTLRRIHLEEDAGKTIHDARRGESQVDLNRAGVPLVEIVSEPVLRSSEEAVAYLKALHRLVVWLDVSDGNMEAGNFRCDANVSVHRPGEPLGTRSEVKNVNSFRFVGQAIEAEIKRQIALLESGQKVRQETRGWDEGTGQTRPLRSKEDAHDYRYFPDPDLLVLEVPQALYDAEAAALPELPWEAELRLQALGLSAYDAAVICADRDTLSFFAEALAVNPDYPKQTASSLTSALFGVLKKGGHTLLSSPISAGSFGELLGHHFAGTLSGTMLKLGLQALLRPGVSVASWVEEHGGQVSDSAALGRVIDPLLDRSPAQVADYLAGKDKIFGYFVGQAMRALHGKANPEELQRALRERLDARRR